MTAYRAHALTLDGRNEFNPGVKRKQNLHPECCCFFIVARMKLASQQPLIELSTGLEVAHRHHDTVYAPLSHR